MAKSDIDTMKLRNWDVTNLLCKHVTSTIYPIRSRNWWFEADTSSGRESLKWESFSRGGRGLNFGLGATTAPMPLPLYVRGNWREVSELLWWNQWERCLLKRFIARVLGLICSAGKDTFEGICNALVARDVVVLAWWCRMCRAGIRSIADYCEHETVHSVSKLHPANVGNFRKDEDAKIGYQEISSSRFHHILITLNAWEVVLALNVKLCEQCLKWDHLFTCFPVSYLRDLGYWMKSDRNKCQACSHKPSAQLSAGAWPRVQLTF